MVLHEDVTQRLIDKCVGGELDVAVLALPLEDERLRVEPLMTEELLLALPAKSRLTGARRVSIGDLSGEPFILIGEMHCLGQQVISLCRDHACRPRLTCRSAQLLTVQRLVAQCAGRPSARVQYRRLSNTPPPCRTLAAAWHARRYERPIVRRLVERLQRHCRSLQTHLEGLVRAIAVAARGRASNGR
jgi:LysR family hydrogen peroxide-inducible transcriptional activator